MSIVCKKWVREDGPYPQPWEYVRDVIYKNNMRIALSKFAGLAS